MITTGIKYFTLFFLIAIFQLSNVNSQAAIQAPNGEGSQERPYEIATLDDLYWITENPGEWDKNYLQIADIDASSTIEWDNGKGFLPVGNEEIIFEGDYNGNGFIISGLTINRPDLKYVGMFGLVEKGFIQNIGLSNLNVIGKSYVGGLIGLNCSHVSQCYTTGKVTGIKSNKYYGTAVGGLVGMNGHIYFRNPSIEKSFSSCIVSGDRNIGGFIGMNIGKVQNSYSMGSASGSEIVGGFIGCINNVFGNVEILHCYSCGSSNGEVAGGFCGHIENLDVIPRIEICWDLETSGNIYFSGELETGCGKTTSEMKDINSYTKSINSDCVWDFVGNLNDDKENNDYWDINPFINNGYPHLINFIPLYTKKLYQNQLNFYPNPASKSITVLIPEEILMYHMRIYNSIGQLESFVVIHSREQIIDISNLSSGNYFLQIIKENDTWVGKLIVEQ